MKKLSVLLADDAQDFAEVLAWQLRESGHHVACAVDGNDGAAFLKKVRFDLVITDIIMPGMGGLELIEIVKKFKPQARILAITGGGKLYSAQAGLKPAGKGGADAVLLKPFGPEILMRTVEQIFSVNTG